MHQVASFETRSTYKRIYNLWGGISPLQTPLCDRRSLGRHSHWKMVRWCAALNIQARLFSSFSCPFPAPETHIGRWKNLAFLRPIFGLHFSKNPFRRPQFRVKKNQFRRLTQRLKTWPGTYLPIFFSTTSLRRRSARLRRFWSTLTPYFDFQNLPPHPHPPHTHTLEIVRSPMVFTLSGTYYTWPFVFFTDGFFNRMLARSITWSQQQGDPKPKLRFRHGVFFADELHEFEMEMSTPTDAFVRVSL